MLPYQYMVDRKCLVLVDWRTLLTPKSSKIFAFSSLAIWLFILKTEKYLDLYCTTFTATANCRSLSTHTYVHINLIIICYQGQFFPRTAKWTWVFTKAHLILDFNINHHYYLFQSYNKHHQNWATLSTKPSTYHIERFNLEVPILPLSGNKIFYLIIGLLDKFFLKN